PGGPVPAPWSGRPSRPAHGSFSRCAKDGIMSTRQQLRTVFAVLLALWVTAPGAPAQTTTGGVTGVVRDSDGGVVPGATVRATADATGSIASTVSSENGQYVLRGLAPGSYVVEVELSGFQTVRVENVTVRVNEDAR